MTAPPAPDELERLSYFDLSAWLVGAQSMHPGRLDSTLALAEMCGLARGDRLLVVGCGPGQSDLFLAERTGCATVGVDLRASMLGLAAAGAGSRGLARASAFVRADAAALPFAASAFDAVICEGALAFMSPKPLVVAEMVRVVRPGGCVGVVEYYVADGGAVPPATARAVSDIVGVEMRPMTAAMWRELFEGAGAELAGWRDSATRERPQPAREDTAAFLGGRLGELYERLPEARRAALVAALLPRVEAANAAFNAIRRHMRYAVFAYRRPG